MMNEKNKNVAASEFKKYVYFTDKHVGSLLEELFPDDLLACILDYSKMDECEHFEAVINFEPKTFRFVWAWNEMNAWRNWACDLQRYKLFVIPDRITLGSILKFNEGPDKMQRFTCYFPPLDESVMFPEDDIVAAFIRGASIITARPAGLKKNTKTRYDNICVNEYEKYLLWMNVELIRDIPLPKEIAKCIIGYAILDECEHFEAVIRINPGVFSFVYSWNDIHYMPNWFARRSRSEEPYVPLDRLLPGTMLEFNRNFRTMIDSTGALGCGSSSGSKAVYYQFKRNARFLLYRARSIGVI